MGIRQCRMALLFMVLDDDHPCPQMASRTLAQAFSLILPHQPVSGDRHPSSSSKPPALQKEADIKVYLYASDEVRAKRIQNREGGSLEEIASFTRMRDEQDSSRYKKLYNIDNNDYSFVDLEIDTSLYNPEEIVEKIITLLLDKKLLNLQ